jgi:hypothetical protein
LRAQPSLDALFAEALRAGEHGSAQRELLARGDLDGSLLLSLLRRPVPLRLLELVAATPPWSERPALLGAVVLNPRSPRALALRLLPSLHWRDLADAAASAQLQSPVRVRAEALLKERLGDLRLGDRITLARIATAPLLGLLLADADAKVVGGALDNPRLREADLRRALRASRVSRVLLEQAARSPRWNTTYGVRLELVLQPATPLALSLSQLSSLVPADLRRVAGTTALRPLVQAAARRLVGEALSGTTS